MDNDNEILLDELRALRPTGATPPAKGSPRYNYIMEKAMRNAKHEQAATHADPAGHPKRRIWIATAVAASLLLLAGIGFANRPQSDSFEVSNTAASDDTADQTIGAVRESQARLLSEQVDDFMSEQVDDMIALARSDEVVTRAVADYTQLYEDRELPAGIPNGDQIASLDDRPGNPAPDVLDATGNTYLSNQVENQTVNGKAVFSWMFFTNKYGYTVSEASPASDFVQSDEGWWVAARDQSVLLGPIGFDESYKDLGSDVAVRIVDSNGNFAGVLRGTVEFDVIKTLSSELTERSENTSVLVVDGEGQVLVDTGSENEADGVGGVVDLKGDRLSAFERAKDNRGASGSIAFEDVVVGYASSSPVRFIERNETNVSNPALYIFVEEVRQR